MLQAFSGFTHATFQAKQILAVDVWFQYSHIGTDYILRVYTPTTI